MDKMSEMMRNGRIKSLEDLNSIIQIIEEEYYNKEINTLLEINSKYDSQEHENDIRDKYQSNIAQSQKNASVKSKIKKEKLNGTYAPQILKKYQRDAFEIEKNVLFLYEKNKTASEIADVLKIMLNLDISNQEVEKMSDRFLIKAAEFNFRPLEKMYPLIFIDEITYFQIGTEEKSVRKTAYIITAYKLDGLKEILRFEIKNDNDSNQWHTIMNDMKLRGLENPLIISCDNDNKIIEAINQTFSTTKILKTIVQQIRKCIELIGYDDNIEFRADMKKIYRSASLKNADIALEKLEKKWDSKHLKAVELWRQNYEDLKDFLNLPREIRKIIYSTDVVESFQSIVFKMNDDQIYYATENILLKNLLSASLNQMKKWKYIYPNWENVLNEFLLFSKNRLENKKK